MIDAELNEMAISSVEQVEPLGSKVAMTFEVDVDFLLRGRSRVLDRLGESLELFQAMRVQPERVPRRRPGVVLGSIHIESLVAAFVLVAGESRTDGVSVVIPSVNKRAQIKF